MNDYYLVIVRGIDAFIPTKQIFKVKGKRKALKLKRKILDRNALMNINIQIKKYSVNLEERENWLF